MSRQGWRYESYWYEGAPFSLENDQNNAEIDFDHDGRLSVCLTGCRECGSWSSWDKLTLEQAIELGAYINCVIIPNLEKESE